MASFLEDLEGLLAGFDGLTAEVRRKVQEMWQGPSMWEQMQAFAHAVDWTVRRFL